MVGCVACSFVRLLVGIHVFAGILVVGNSLAVRMIGGSLAIWLFIGWTCIFGCCNLLDDWIVGWLVSWLVGWLGD